VRILRREVDVVGVGAGLLMLSSVPRHGYVGRRGGRDVHQYRRRPTITILFVGQTERNRHGVPSEFNSPCRHRRPRPRMAVSHDLRSRGPGYVGEADASLPSRAPVASLSSPDPFVADTGVSSPSRNCAEMRPATVPFTVPVNASSSPFLLSIERTASAEPVG
jgi:hypothetical protein